MKIAEVEKISGIGKMNKDVSVEQDHLVSIVSNGLRGRIEEQRCSLAPRTSQQVPVYSPDPDEIYQLLVNSQSRRLDDQRVMLASLPGIEAFTIKEQKETNPLKTSFDHICNMVSSANSFRRRTPRKMPLTPGSPGSMRAHTQHCDDSHSVKKLPSTSASFSPISDKDRMDYDSFQGEQEQLFCLVSKAQRGSIDKQRCSINPLSHSTEPSDEDAEQFFTLIANTQNRRIDDQRATLNMLPGILQSTGQESDQLFNIISGIQGSRIDDQRCSAPQIQLGSPLPPRKSYSQPVSPTIPTSESGSPSISPQKPASFSPVSEEQNHFDQDQFFSLVHNIQQRRMDDQRCSFEPNKYSSSTPKRPNITPITDSQSRRMDDRFVSLNSSSIGNHRERNKACTPQITLTPASPAAPKKPHSRPTSPSLMFCDSPVRSFSPGADEQRMLYDDMTMQIPFQISMRFPPHKAYGTDNHPCQLPEVFLTIGQPGDTVVIPLNLKPGRPLSFNINPPYNHHSRSVSPHRSPARQGRERSSPNRVNATSPHEDYLSLIQRVHTAQLQNNNGQERGDMSRETKRGKKMMEGKRKKKENREKKK